AKANTGAPWYPIAYGIAEGLKLTATGLQIGAMVGELTEKSIYVAHQYGIPRMMEEDLYAENLNDTSTAKALEIFKKMTYYKSPITLENGYKWENYDGTYDSDGEDDITDTVTGSGLDGLKSIYGYYSPVGGNQGFTYKSEGLMRDEWQTAQVTADSQSGDCEDYAILAASRALRLKDSNGDDAPIPASDLRIVNGLVGYGGPDPKSHTVLLYQDNSSLSEGSRDNFSTTKNAATGKQEFTDSGNIYVIDLGTEYNPTTGTFYTLEEYQNEFGYFQPTYSYDSPGADVNLNYDFKDFEIFGYTPSAMMWPDSHGEPKGPQDLVASDGTYTYYFDQNSSRKLIVDIYDGTTFIEQREISGKIDYGVEEYSITDPDGQLKILLLDNAAPGIGSNEVDEDG
ncbi:MAG: hypothetical protein VXX85_05555, partial [Candidatus Margulisiibacteriota bacterium]|nr:hypothetical protein [Candidatus Margulisiibacteriota bacterium]